MIEAFLGLPAHLRRRLAKALESGMVDTSSPLESLRSVVGLKQGGEDVMAGLGALQAMGVVGSAAAAWLRTVEGDVLRFLSKKNDVWFPKLKPVPVMGTEKENHTSWERYYRVSDCSSSSRNDWYLGR